MYRLFIVCLIFSFGCKESTAPTTIINDVARAKNQPPPQEEITDLATNNKIVVPNATKLVPRATIAKIIGEDPEHLEIKQGNSVSEKNYQACFIKWPSGFPNAGILLQVSRNPVYDEFRDWAISFIDSKKTSGETLPGTEELVKFKDYTEHGDSGAYNYEAGKYYWRINRDYVITVAFNIDWNEAKQYRVATELGTEVMKKF